MGQVVIKPPPPPPPPQKRKMVEITHFASSKPHFIEGNIEYVKQTSKRCKYCSGLSLNDEVKCKNCGASF